jgi:hypothetical protein
MFSHVIAPDSVVQTQRAMLARVRAAEAEEQREQDLRNSPAFRLEQDRLAAQRRREGSIRDALDVLERARQLLLIARDRAPADHHLASLAGALITMVDAGTNRPVPAVERLNVPAKLPIEGATA